MQQRVNVHTKVFEAPIQFSIDEMVQEAREIFGEIGIEITQVTDEAMDLTDPEIASLASVDVGACTTLTDISEDHRDLALLRDHAIPDTDIVVYFCKYVSVGRGCAALLPNGPMAILAVTASLYTLAHEIGHLLGLFHVTDTNRLMVDRTTTIINPPPDLIEEEIAIIKKSRFVLS